MIKPLFLIFIKILFLNLLMLELLLLFWRNGIQLVKNFRHFVFTSLNFCSLFYVTLVWKIRKLLFFNAILLLSWRFMINMRGRRVRFLIFFFELFQIFGCWRYLFWLFIISLISVWYKWWIKLSPLDLRIIVYVFKCCFKRTNDSTILYGLWHFK